MNYENLNKDNLVSLLLSRDREIKNLRLKERAYFLKRSLAVKEGMKIAKANGQKLGRKPIEHSQELIQRILTLRCNGRTFRKISSIVKLDKSTVHRICKDGGHIPQKTLTMSERLKVLEDAFENLERRNYGIT